LRALNPLRFCDDPIGEGTLGFGDDPIGEGTLGFGDDPIGGVDCGFVFVWPFVSGTFGQFGTWMTLSVPAFKVDFYEECISSISGPNENST
jgi:hypothetical protein